MNVKEASLISYLVNVLDGKAEMPSYLFDEFADLSRKDETVEIHFEALELCKKHNIDVSFFMIFGFPTETADDRKKTFELVRDSGVVATKYNNMIYILI